MFAHIARKNLNVEYINASLIDGATNTIVMNIQDPPKRYLGVVAVDSNMTTNEKITQFIWTPSSAGVLDIQPLFQPTGITRDFTLAIFYEK